MLTSPPTGTATPAATARVHDAGLDHLDELLVELRRVMLRPGYRRALLGDLAGTVGLATVRLLRSVQRAPEPPSIGEVAEVLAIDPSTASRLVERAAAAELLERRACADDRRRARLHLRPAGVELLATVTARRRDLLTAAVEGWDQEELATLQRLVERLLAGFDAATGSA
ncbi:MAG: MarR family winged helix-turn-helix transcriptional regulator [Nitriliruptoraceae bacterium]